MNHSTVPETLWRARLQALVDAWPRMNEEAEALHQVRVASRRLREALPVLAQGRRRKKLKKARRTMRRITRALGPVRELDVAIHALSALEANDPPIRQGVEHLSEHLVAERAEKRADMARRLDKLSPERIERRLVAIVDTGVKPHKRPGAAKHSESSPWRSVLAARIARRAKALRTAIERAGAIYLPDRLHAVRVTVKKLRYAIEVGRDVRIPRTAAMLRTLKSAQDTLGQLHGCEVLIDRAREAQGTSVSSADVGADLNAVIARLEQHCRQLHARFVTRREELLAVCDQASSDLKRALATIRPTPMRVVPAAAPSGRPRRDRAADVIDTAGRHDARNA
jgi:CHAD domain-containing protein